MNPSSDEANKHPHDGYSDRYKAWDATSTCSLGAVRPSPHRSDRRGLPSHHVPLPSAAIGASSAMQDTYAYSQSLANIPGYDVRYPYPVAEPPSFYHPPIVNTGSSPQFPVYNPNGPQQPATLCQETYAPPNNQQPYPQTLSGQVVYVPYVRYKQPQVHTNSGRYGAYYRGFSQNQSNMPDRPPVIATNLIPMKEASRTTTNTLPASRTGIPCDEDRSSSDSDQKMSRRVSSVTTDDLKKYTETRTRHRTDMQGRDRNDEGQLISFPDMKQTKAIYCGQHPVQALLNCSITKNVFYHDNNWTCYRRNYINVACSYELEDFIPGVQLWTYRDDGSDVAIQALGVGLTASVDGPEGKEVSLVKYTAKRDAKETQAISITKLLPAPLGGDMYLGYEQAVHNGPSLPLQHADNTDNGTIPPPNAHTFERIQFKTATANNGRRRAAQQFYNLIVQLYADIRSPTAKYPEWIVIAHRISEQIVVRGRSPGHYRNQGPNETNTTPSFNSPTPVIINNSIGDCGYTGTGEDSNIQPARLSVDTGATLLSNPPAHGAWPFRAFQPKVSINSDQTSGTPSPTSSMGSTIKDQYAERIGTQSQQSEQLHFAPYKYNTDGIAETGGLQIDKAENMSRPRELNRILPTSAKAFLGDGHHITAEGIETDRFESSNMDANARYGYAALSFSY